MLRLALGFALALSLVTAAQAHVSKHAGPSHSFQVHAQEMTPQERFAYDLAYNGNPCAIGLTCDASGNLQVNIVAGAAACCPLSGSTSDNTGTGQSVGVKMLNNAGTQLIPIQADASGNLKAAMAGAGSGNPPTTSTIGACDSFATALTSANTVTPFSGSTLGSFTPTNISPQAGQRIYICSISEVITNTNGTNNPTLQWSYSAASTCTSPTTFGPANQFTAIGQGETYGNGLGTVLFVPQGNVPCINSVAAGSAASVFITYRQAP